MNEDAAPLPDVLRHSPVRVVFGSGTVDQLGSLAKAEEALRVLVVTDRGVAAAGHLERAVESLRRAGLSTIVFDGARENPTTEQVAHGLESVKGAELDLIVGLGGGSAMDCAKGINLLLTNGGQMGDYLGTGKAERPLLPSIAVPTTAGTGSEAQSFALIAEPVSHQKIACGDRRSPYEGGLRPRVAILDPDLTATQPPSVAATAALDAASHAIETAATTARTHVSEAASCEAWRLIHGAFERALRIPGVAAARGELLLGAHLAGIAIELSMLGAAHACANPLTARLDLVHGHAVAVMLPPVIRFNAADGTNPYAALGLDPEALAARVESMLEAGGLPLRLSDFGVAETDLPELADVAARQWTAQFNPRPVGPAELRGIYSTVL